MLLNGLLVSSSFFAFIPYLTYFLSQQLAWAPILVGTLLMVRQLSQQGLTFFTGLIADRFDYRWMITIGLWIRGVGFASFAFTEQPILLFAAAVTAGVGGALFEPVMQASLSALSTEKQRGMVFAFRKICNNMGIVFAALVGAWLINYDFFWLSIGSGVMFLLIGTLTLIRLPVIKVDLTTANFKEMGSTVLRDRPFLFFTGVVTCFWFLFMQLYVAIPLYIVELSGRADSVSLVYLIFAGVVILGQYPLQRLLEEWTPTRRFMVGFFLAGGGLFILGAIPHLTIFFIGLFIFSVGTMMVEPTIFDITSRLAKKGLLATYFGFAALGMAIGGGGSQGVGAYLLDVSYRMNFPLLWLICLVISLVAIVGSYKLSKQINPLFQKE
ncbi:MFS transporter [Bacillus horti]